MAIIPATGFFAVSAPAEAGFSVGFSSVQHLTTGPYDSDVTVAPDGNRLVFTRSGQLWTAMVDGSQPTRIDLPFGYVSNPDWGPDGYSLAITASPTGYTRDENLYLVDLRDRSTRQVTTAGPTRDADFSPDGQRLAYRKMVMDGSDTDRIYTVRVDGSANQAVTASGLNASRPAWSPDGTAIAYTFEVYDTVTKPKLHVIRPDGTDDRRLADPGAAPAWSPDGSMLAFAQDGALVTLSADGSGTIAT